MNTTLPVALQYLAKGLSIIPVGRDKKPLISWQAYQEKRATEEEIKTWPENNIGIITGKISNLTVVDLDSQKAVDFFLANYKGETPCADTPRGMHAYFRYEPGTRNTVKVNGIDMDVRSEGGYVVAPPSINADGKSYRWLQSILDVAPAPLPDFLKESIKDLSNTNKGYKEGVVSDNKRQQTTTFDNNDNILFQKGTRDKDLFYVGNRLIEGGCKPDIALQVLEILANNCNPPFSQKEVLEKIKSVLSRCERRERNLTAEIREWVLTTSGIFMTTDVYIGQHLTTREEKKAAAVILSRLAEKEGIIEKYGTKHGCYRTVDNKCEEIDFINTPSHALDIHWPFEIERFVKTLPKNIIVIAGESNSGKTAFLLNVAEKNMDKYDIQYFSSEMGALELKDRLSKFDRPLNTWVVKFKERASNFADVIKPDAINIIDFLEVHDEFYKIGGLIKDIYDKLNTGVAVIAIQKNRGTDFGLGGMRSIEKARLYCAMEPGKIRIVKGKNWASYANPNGLECEWSLIQGCHFKTDKTWRKG